MYGARSYAEVFKIYIKFALMSNEKWSEWNIKFMSDKSDAECPDLWKEIMYQIWLLYCIQHYCLNVSSTILNEADIVLIVHHDKLYNKTNEMYFLESYSDNIFYMFRIGKLFIFRKQFNCTCSLWYVSCWNTLKVFKLYIVINLRIILYIKSYIKC